MNERPAETVFNGRLALQQRVLPSYRIPFFDRLAVGCEHGMAVFAGAPRPQEAILSGDQLSRADLKWVHNLHFFHGSLYLCLQRGLLAGLRDWDPDVLILEANPRYLTNWRVLDWMRQRGRPVIGWGLGAPMVQGVVAPWRERLRVRFLQRFDGLIAYSTQGAQEYRQAGASAARVFTAPNAVSGPPPPFMEKPARYAGSPRLLFVGRLQARKRVDLLLQACASLSHRPELTIVGDGPVRVELEALSKRLYPKAAFVGAQGGPALEAIFHQADLFVLPGTGGLAVQEAMAHGLPVVVAEGDGTQNDLATGGNGWLVPPGDLQALSETLEQALADPARLRSMGRISHTLVQERFNINAMAEVFMQAIHAIVGEA